MIKWSKVTKNSLRYWSFKYINIITWSARVFKVCQPNNVSILCVNPNSHLAGLIKKWAELNSTSARQPQYGAKIDLYFGCRLPIYRVHFLEFIKLMHNNNPWRATLTTITREQQSKSTSHKYSILSWRFDKCIWILWVLQVRRV